MDKEENRITILIAEDNEIDRLLAEEALERVGSDDDLRFVEDGQELMDYLRHHGKYAGHKMEAPRPGLILLDLMLPRKSGYEALDEIKTDPDLRQIPVMVMTTSDTPEDRLKTYGMDAKHYQAGIVRGP